MRKVIEVTQKHIDIGTPLHSNHCPIALAVKEHLKEKISFGISQIQYHIDEFEFGNTMDEVKEFISRFDNNLSVQPFTFELDIPDEYLRK